MQNFGAKYEFFTKCIMFFLCSLSSEREAISIRSTSIPFVVSPVAHRSAFQLDPNANPCVVEGERQWNVPLVVWVVLSGIMAKEPARGTNANGMLTWLKASHIRRNCSLDPSRACCGLDFLTYIVAHSRFQ